MLVPKMNTRELSMRGHHDLHSGVTAEDNTIRRLREDRTHRRATIVSSMLHQFAFIDEIVEMNRLNLNFNDAQIEAKYETFSNSTRFEHMKFGTYSFTAFLVFCQIVYIIDGSTNFETGLPTTGSVWYFVILMVAACLLLLALSFFPNHNPRLGAYLNYFFYIVGSIFVVYMFGLVSDLSSELEKGEEGNMKDIIDRSSETNSLNHMVDSFNEADSLADAEALAEVARISVWWQLASSCTLIAVCTIMVLDAITMTTFLWSFSISLGSVIGLLVIFGTSGGPAIVFAAIILGVHVWNIRFAEITTRKEFIIAQNRMDEIVQEEDKLKRKSEALEAKLKLTTDQLKMIEAAEEEVVGDNMAELGAWKVDVDTEVLFDRKVAAGSFGIVYLAKMRATGRDVAVKQLLSDQVNPENMERFFSEILLHSTLHHPHLVEMIGASWEPPNLCLILAYCEGGDLKGLLESEWKTLQWPSHKLRMVKEISQAIAYLHSHKIMHRDLKTANVLVDKNLKMRVSDFGESRVLKNSDVNLTMVGTNFYIAPEVFRGDSDYGFKADIFSLGMIMLAMTIRNGSLRDFFVDSMGMKVKINANHASIRMNDGWRPDLMAHKGRITGEADLSNDPKLREALAKFIKTLISPSPNERPDMNDIVKSLDNLDRWICVNPPSWAAKLDKRIVLGTSVCHPDRGVGSIVSFDGFERVHVLYEDGQDLYRRYSEEGWVAKMSIGNVVTNPNARGSQPKGGGLRRLSVSLTKSNKVGIDKNKNKGDSYGYDTKGGPASIGLSMYSDLDKQQSLGVIEPIEGLTNTMSAINDVQESESAKNPDDSSMQNPSGTEISNGLQSTETSPVPGRSLINPKSKLAFRGQTVMLTKQQEASKLKGSGSLVPAQPQRKARRRSSLIALAEDHNFDPNAAIAQALKNAGITDKRCNGKLNNFGAVGV